MKTNLYIITIAIFITSNLFAKTYNIIGNTRTKTEYIEHLIKKCEKRASIKLSQCLLNAEIFSAVDVQEFPEKTLVEIKERWTLIPVPQIKISDSGSTYGGFVVERNFLGRGKLAVLGGSIGDGSNSYMLFLKDRDFMYTDWILEFLAMKSDTDQEAYSSDKLQYGVNEKDSLLKSGVGYRIVPEIETMVAFAYQDIKYKSLKNYSGLRNYHSWTYEVEFKYQNSNYKFYFKEGIEAYFIYAKQFSRSDKVKKISKDILGIKYQKNVWKRHALQLAFKLLILSNTSTKDLEKIGSTPGFRGIQEGGLWTDRAMTVSADYQIPISSRGYGTWTIAPFIDYGIYESTYTEKRNFRSYGLGAYLYLKKVALPGIGIIVGNNNRFEGDFVSLSIGLGRRN